MITRDDILMGRDAEYPLDYVLEANLTDLLDAANDFAAAYAADTGRTLKITSGYRPGRFNTAAGGAKASAHLGCMAIDWADPDGAVDAWIQQHLSDMWAWGFTGIEHPDKTPGWAHTDMKHRGVQVFR